MCDVCMVSMSPNRSLASYAYAYASTLERYVRVDSQWARVDVPGHPTAGPTPTTRARETEGGEGEWYVVLCLSVTSSGVLGAADRRLEANGSYDVQLTGAPTARNAEALDPSFPMSVWFIGSEV